MGEGGFAGARHGVAGYGDVAWAGGRAWVGPGEIVPSAYMGGARVPLFVGASAVLFALGVGPMLEHVLLELQLKMNRVWIFFWA